MVDNETNDEANDGLPAPTNQNMDTTTKGFFDLPRELRDEIYELAHYHKFAHGPISGATFVYTFSAPHPHLRLVSKQFKSEYEERAPSQTSLLVSQARPIDDWRWRNDWSWWNDDTLITCPPLAQLCTVLELDFYLFDGIDDYDGYHKNDANYHTVLELRVGMINQHIKDSIHVFPHIRDIRVTVSFNFITNFNDIKRIINLGILYPTRPVSRVDIKKISHSDCIACENRWYCDNGHHWMIPSTAAAKKPMTLATWTPGNQDPLLDRFENWEEDKEAQKACEQTHAALTIWRFWIARKARAEERKTRGQKEGSN